MFLGLSWSNLGKNWAFCMKCATKSLLFALFSDGIRWRYHARRGICEARSGRGYPQKYSPGTKSHFFWMRLNSEKLKNLRKTKKARPESGAVGEGSPLGEGWSDGVDPSDLADRNRVGCNGTVADLEPRKRAREAERSRGNCNRIDTNCNGRGKKRCTVAIL